MPTTKTLCYNSLLFPDCPWFLCTLEVHVHRRASSVSFYIMLVTDKLIIDDDDAIEEVQ